MLHSSSARSQTSNCPYTHFVLHVNKSSPIKFIDSPLIANLPPPPPKNTNTRISQGETCRRHVFCSKDESSLPTQLFLPPFCFCTLFPFLAKNDVQILFYWTYIGLGLEITRFKTVFIVRWSMAVALRKKGCLGSHETFMKYAEQATPPTPFSPPNATPAD